MQALAVSYAGSGNFDWISRIRQSIGALFDPRSPLRHPADGPAYMSDDARRDASRTAFEEAFGHDPADQVDWETAYALNPNSYDPDYLGTKPVIKAVRINPVDGQGVVRMGAFIDVDKVANGYQTMIDTPSNMAHLDPKMTYNLGDNRGPQLDFDPERTRISTYVDYKNGMVIIRQNPSVQLNDDGKPAKAKTGTPDAQVWQAKDGSVRIKYSGHDAFVPTAGGPTLGTVNGDIVVTPGQGVAGTPGSTGAVVNGRTTEYPWFEIYQDATNGNQHTIGIQQPPKGIDTEKLGPNAGLWVDHDIGSGLAAIAPFQHKLDVDPRAMRGAPNVDTTVDQPSAEAASVEQAPKAPVYASGGDVKGPGSSIGDKVPAYLSDGEFVMNARSTAVNRPFLQALNSDPNFLQKMLAQRAKQNSSGGPAFAQSAPSGQPATVNISTSSSEDIVGRLKVLSLQWELMHSH